MTTVARPLRDSSWLIVRNSPNGRRSCWTVVRARTSSRACNAARVTSSRLPLSIGSGAVARATYRQRRRTAPSPSRRRSTTSSSRIKRSLFWSWRLGKTAAARWPTSSSNIGGCPGIGCSVRTYNSSETWSHEAKKWRSIIHENMTLILPYLFRRRYLESFVLIRKVLPLILLIMHVV